MERTGMAKRSRKLAIDAIAVPHAPVAAGQDKRRLIEVGGNGRDKVMVNALENPLAWLVARGKISLRQFAAGERLRADFELAGKGVRVTMRWDGEPTAPRGRGAPEPLDPRESQIAAKARFEGAVAAAGPGLSDVLWRTVCNGEGLEVTERDMGWPARAGKVVLALALDRVAAFYRL